MAVKGKESHDKPRFLAQLAVFLFSEQEVEGAYFARRGGGSYWIFETEDFH